MSLFGRRERREIAELKECIDRLRAERDEFEKDRDTAVFNQQEMARNQGALLDEHRRVVARNQALGAQLEAAQVANGFDRAGAQKTADRIKRLREAVAEARGEASTEKRRANHLQQRLDDAVGLPPGRIKDSREWQPGYKKPTVEGATT